MNNLETYLHELIEKTVRNALHAELEPLYVLLQQQKAVNRKVSASTVTEEKAPGLKVIRPKELAELLSISIPTLYRMENKGKLPPKRRISKRVVGWLSSDIEQWLKDEAIVTDIV